jgi:hypothetical protein
MVLVYNDDILIFAKDPKMTMDKHGKLYKLKPKSVKEPNIYLGANMEKSNCQMARWNGQWVAESFSRSESG